jgi:nucleotide-binding universal stress UspA family protein
LSSARLALDDGESRHLFCRRRESTGSVNRPFRTRSDTTADGDRRRRAPIAYKRILVPVTASTASDHAIATAGQLASEQKAKVTLLNVIEVPKDLPLDALFPDEERDGRDVLGRATEILDQYGVRSHSRLMRSSSVAAAILEVADDERPEIIVIGAERRLRRQRSVSGSNLQAVLTGASCRVMLVSPWPDALTPAAMNRG